MRCLVWGSDSNGGVCINLPTGVRQVKISVLFGEPCSEDKRETIVNYIKQFIDSIQKGIKRGGVEIYRFGIFFDFDVYDSCVFDIHYRQWTVKRRRKSTKSKSVA